MLLTHSENHPPGDENKPVEKSDRDKSPASTSFRDWLILFTVAALTLAVDQLSKWVVVRSLDYRETWVPIPLLEGIFDLTYTRNTGAAFGLAQEAGNIFLVVAVAVCVLIIYYYRRLPKGYFLVRFALGLEMGGALGNALDRITRGYVVDFFHLHGWPIFNIADSVIVLGVVILIVMMWWHDYQVDKEKKAPAQNAGAAEEVSSSEI